MSVEWMDRALCAQIGGDMWFPEKGGSSRAALAVCQSCPVTNECLQFALTLNPDEQRHGIWGGMTPSARELMDQTKMCPQCRTHFTPTLRGQRLCSNECRTQSRKDTLARSAKKHHAA